MKPIVTRLVGVSFNGAQENIKKFGCADIGSFELVREADNEHDPNAIRVVIAEFFLGYVPKNIAAWLAPRMDAGKRLGAEYVCLNKHPYHDAVGLTVRIYNSFDNFITKAR